MIKYLALIVMTGLLSFGADAQSNYGSARSGAPQSMNPDTSVNILTLYKNGQREGATSPEPDSGFLLQEVEMQFLADVDPYLRASALLSVHPADTAPVANANAPADKTYEIEPEEVFLETTSIPYLTIKAGRFHAALGRHNTLHTHAFPFIDAPLINQRLLGSDGLTEVGVSGSLLLPLPWYSEAIAQGVQGDSPDLFQSKNPSNIATVYRLRNLFDITDAMTFDLGLSGASGKNYYGGQTSVGGADMTVKWRPIIGGKYQAFILAGEYLQGAVNGRADDSHLAGGAYWLQYQFAERWWIQGRGEQLASDTDSKTTQKYSALVAFLPSEFSGFRFQYDRLMDTQALAAEYLHVAGKSNNWRASCAFILSEVNIL